MANFKRQSNQSNQSKNANRRRSIRRGGAPPTPPPPPPAPRRNFDFVPSVIDAEGNKQNTSFLSGRNGSACADRNQPDCGKIKACEWRNANKTQSAHCRRRNDSGTSFTTDKYKSMSAELDAKRAQSLKDLYDSEKSSDDSQSFSSEASSPDGSVDSYVAPVRAAPFRASAAASAPVRAVSRKASSASKRVSPAQARKSVAKASGVAYVPTKSALAPVGCTYREGVVTTKRGTSYASSRCVDSKDPAVNDTEHCMVNPATNKCKKVSRA